MESDEAPDLEILAAIAEALDALNQTQPALILEITAARRSNTNPLDDRLRVRHVIGQLDSMTRADNQ
jgi:hypothetical protein